MNIPHNHKEEMFFDAENVNTNWKDTEIFKIKQIYNFNPFDYLGPATSSRILPGHTNIKVHLIYYYKQYSI